MAKSLRLIVSKGINALQAMTNYIYLNSSDFDKLAKILNSQHKSIYVSVQHFVWLATASSDIKDSGVAIFNNIQRATANLAFDDQVDLIPFTFNDEDNIYITSLDLEVGLLKKSSPIVDIDGVILTDILKTNFNCHFLCFDQRFQVNYDKTVLIFRVTDIKLNSDNKSKSLSNFRGLLTANTEINLVSAINNNIHLKNTQGSTTLAFKPGFDLKNLEIGGLDDQFQEIFRRAFASRCIPTKITEELGIKHIRGMLLYGPPGTGKTLMARQIAKMFDSREPKIVNGPELLSKYVGQSEENIRKLFIEAEQEFIEKGDNSKLHVIIFDEIDAICKSRGSVSTGVNDTVVNQLLSKIDGVDSLNNILVIGMTNRKEMLDDALLRPGRLEVHIEIGLPDEKGRLQIFNIHTNKIKQSNHLHANVDLLELATITKNYTGAEIAGIVKGACSYSFNRQIDINNLHANIDSKSIIITREDFLKSIKELPPKFGVSEDEFNDCIRQGIIEYGPKFTKIVNTCKGFIQQVKNSNLTPMVTTLIEGISGSGKTALSAHLAMLSEFPYVKIITADKLINYSGNLKVQYLYKIFSDSYKSPLSVIVLDDIERIIEYVRIGPQFSNLVLQALMVLLKKVPEKGRRLLVIGTCSDKDLLDELGLLSCFNACVKIPCVKSGDEVEIVLSKLGSIPKSDLKTISKNVLQDIAIKKLIMVSEMAIQSESNSNLISRFIQCLEDYSLDCQLK